MELTDFLSKRKSTRHFRSSQLKPALAEEVRKKIDQMNEQAADHQVHFDLHTQGKKLAQALDGQAGYGGQMIQAPAYVSMAIDPTNPWSTIYGAYALEDLVTRADQLGLGQCWVTLAETDPALKKELFPKAQGEPAFLLALGLPARSFGFGQQEFSSRFGIEDFVYQDQLGQAVSIQTLENYGLKDIFYYIRFAPSTRNDQPWAFVLKEDGIELYMKKDLAYLVDMGIIMYYYEKLAELSGIQAQWTLGDFKESTDGHYLYIGKTNF